MIWNGWKKSKIVVGQRAQESTWLKLLQNTAEANKTITKGFREEKIFSWKRNFSQSKIILLFSSSNMASANTLLQVSHIRENQKTFLYNNAVQLLPHSSSFACWKQFIVIICKSYDLKINSLFEGNMLSEWVKYTGISPNIGILNKIMHSFNDV